MGGLSQDSVRSSGQPLILVWCLDCGQPVGLQRSCQAGQPHDRDAGPALAQVPCVIAVAYGVPRAAAVRAAIRGGMIKGLVTRTSLARTLLGLA